MKLRKRTNKDYVVTYHYEGEIYITAQNKRQALNNAKSTLEEQHGNDISKWTKFSIKLNRESDFNG